MDILEMIDDLYLPDPPQIHRHRVIDRYRINPLPDISNPNIFKQHFTKENVVKITNMVRPIFHRLT